MKYYQSNDCISQKLFYNNFPDSVLCWKLKTEQKSNCIITRKTSLMETKTFGEIVLPLAVHTSTIIG